MNTLFRLAYKAELAAARKLATTDAVSAEQALTAILEHVAGAAGLTALLAQRAAALAAAQARKAAREQARAQARAALASRQRGPETAWRAWFDGSAHPNPGRCGIGGLLTGPAGERFELSQAAGYGNSSEAEYRALIAVLEMAVQRQACGLTVFGDSQGVIDDVRAADGAAAVSLRAYRVRVKALMARIDGVSLHWVPRRRNAAADALSQRAVAGMAPEHT